MADSTLHRLLWARRLPLRPNMPPRATADPPYLLLGRSLSTQGFSILEVMVVMAIMGILAAIAAPGWLSLTTRQRIGSARDEVLQAIRTTQSKAKQTRRLQLLEFDTSGDIPKVQNVELGNGNIKANTITLTVIDGNGNALTTDWNNNDKIDIAFDQKGTIDIDSTPPEWPIRIVISSPDSGAKRCVLVDSLLGSVRQKSDKDCAF